MSRIALSLVFLLACLTVASALPQRAVLDFDGDHKTDYVILRYSGGPFQTYDWYLQQSTAGFEARRWGSGASNDGPIPGDYDGDGKWDLAVWRSEGPGLLGHYYILQSTNGALRVVQWGVDGDDYRITQDFDGDGKADPAVTRVVSTHLVWYISQSMLGFKSVSFGSPGDVGVRGDFDGDGKADIALYRGIAGSPQDTYFVLRSSDGGFQSMNWGRPGFDTILPADFDGDGKTDYTVFRYAPFLSGADGGYWFWLQSSDGGFHSLHFGQNGDTPVPGDYDGDGKTDQAVWRTTAPILGTPGTFYVNRSLLGYVSLNFGVNGDYPIAFMLQGYCCGI